MRFFIKTFGCQMNELDSGVMRSQLLKKGYTQVLNAKDANLVLLNTCSIREKAYHKAMSEIGRSRSASLLGVTGCVASHAGEEILKKFPYVNFVLGTDHINKLPSVLDEVQKTNKQIAYSKLENLSDYEFAVPLETPGEKQTKALVTITKGCDNACSFCIVPTTRGKEISRNPDDIITEINRLNQNGTREVMLLGQNVNSYGKGLSSKETFASLIRRIDEETKIDRLRFISPHPKDLSKELIAEYGTNTKLCPHIHLPIQSGSDRILNRMRRSYSRRVYLRKVGELRAVAPDVAITTDIIVGFPGETNNDFEQTQTLLDEVQFDQSYIFSYSSRPGTEAATFKDDVSTDLKAERLLGLQNFQKRISGKKNEKWIGKEVPVLVEGTSSGGKGQLAGRNPHGIIVNFDGEKERVGDIMNVRVSWASPFSLRGEQC